MAAAPSSTPTTSCIGALPGPVLVTPPSCRTTLGAAEATAPVPATSATTPTPATTVVRSARATRVPTVLILDNQPPLPVPDRPLTPGDIAVVTCLTR